MEKENCAGQMFFALDFGLDLSPGPSQKSQLGMSGLMDRGRGPVDRKLLRGPWLDIKVAGSLAKLRCAGRRQGLVE